MMLYHGTSAEYLSSILKNGLQPRSKTGNSNYAGDLQSKSDLVYLTKSFPVTYAYSIPDVQDILILQIRVELKDLYPDEDFIERIYFMSGEKKNIKNINPKDYKQHASKSLKIMRSACIEQINPKQIISYKILSVKDHNLHCGLGAQGNDKLSNYELSNTLNVLDPKKVEKCEKRLKILFKKGWNQLKKEIIKDSPSTVIDCPTTGKIELHNGETYSVLLGPNKNLNIFICNKWSKGNAVVHDQRLKDFVQILPNQVKKFHPRVDHKRSIPSSSGLKS